MRKTLNGRAAFTFLDGAVKGVNIGRMIREAKARIEGEPLPPSDEPLQTDFTELSGSINFTDGVGRNDDLHAKSPLLRIRGKGTADLPREQVDYLLTTAIGQAAIAVESIDHYFKQEEMGKRPKVDKHHFDLLAKLRETGLEPTEYQHEEIRGTDEDKFAVHNYDDRSKHEIIPADELFLGHFEFEERLKRSEDVPDSEQVLGHFQERMAGLSEEQAVEEAKRCMSCGMCFECDNCVIYCPQDAVHRVPKDERTLGRYVYTDYTKCIGCHICADVCPTGYIDMGMGE